ncbi:MULTISPECIES: damage-control phosphatase ARMT1 family protein [Streptomyces]|uniref:Protein-glutamate O-methyltransferase family protein n=1 Tax=Streptomyces triticiradicis TaxID=2651189 RepID=A0A7J5D2C5_9ACTN|nr:damage-control phosphatase ARMT1 family protein [Streptomyces triticiradicis]KAB1977127.1 protein-glutamate O-methyltransferase family protein [Streptomyces triticiradicis]
MRDPADPARSAAGPDDAPVVVGSVRGSFPRSVLAERHPAIVRKVRDAFPYGPEQRHALDALLENCVEGVVEPLAEPAPDRARWDAWGGREHYGRSWFDLPFLWSESYFYRKLLEAVGYFTPGPWQGIDPFRPFKLAELDTPEADAELAALDDLAHRPAGEQEEALLHGSLWGNRADLGFRLAGTGSGTADGSRLVADDAEVLRSLFAGGTLCLVADNAGRELVPDLLLVDHLLRHGRAGRTVLHVKPYPYYVSDATTADVLDALRRLTAAKGAAGEAGDRLWAAMSEGRLTVRAHPFSCGPLPYTDLPDDLRQEFAAADVTLLKGDLNYRRLIGDRLHPATTPFAAATAGFPGAVAALRTLKSDVVVGIAPAVEAALDAAEGDRWRTGGTHALIQARRG